MNNAILSSLDFFDLDNRLTLVRAAVQTRVVREFEFMALWTE